MGQAEGWGAPDLVHLAAAVPPVEPIRPEGSVEGGCHRGVWQQILHHLPVALTHRMWAQPALDKTGRDCRVVDRRLSAHIHSLELPRWLETLVALAEPRPSSGADDMCTSSLFSWNVHCLRTIVLELMPT